jgi:hypothetical protein
MQAYAKANGIVAGQHIKDRMLESISFFSIVQNYKGDEKRYIFENPKKGFRYTQYDFNWYGFLKSLPFIESDEAGNLYLIKPGARVLPQPNEQPPKSYDSLTSLISTNKPYQW